MTILKPEVLQKYAPKRELSNSGNNQPEKRWYRINVRGWSRQEILKPRPKNELVLSDNTLLTHYYKYLMLMKLGLYVVGGLGQIGGMISGVFRMSDAIIALKRRQNSKGLFQLSDAMIASGEQKGSREKEGRNTTKDPPPKKIYLGSLPKFKIGKSWAKLIICFKLMTSPLSWGGTPTEQKQDMHVWRRIGIGE